MVLRLPQIRRYLKREIRSGEVVLPRNVVVDRGRRRNGVPWRIAAILKEMRSDVVCQVFLSRVVLFVRRVGCFGITAVRETQDVAGVGGEGSARARLPDVVGELLRRHVRDHRGMRSRWTVIAGVRIRDGHARCIAGAVVEIVGVEPKGSRLCRAAQWRRGRILPQEPKTVEPYSNVEEPLFGGAILIGQRSGIKRRCGAAIGAV